MILYHVFVRNWWREAESHERGIWPNNLVPDPGARKHTLGYRDNETKARMLAKGYNETHKPGRLSRKAEYERED
jgi:hypothetical protein